MTTTATASAELVTWGGDAMPDGVTITPATPARLTEQGARRLTDRIRGNLEVAARGLVRAWHGQAHVALGYGDGFDGWQAYVDAEFGDLRLLKLPTEDRVELVRSMTEAGGTRAEVARATGSSKAGVQYDLKGRPAPAPAAGTAAGTATEDGAEPRGELGAASTTVVVEPPAGMSKRDRAWQLVLEQGDRGLTSLELGELTGWTGGSCTGTMSDLKRQGRVEARAVFRLGYAAHVAVILDDTP